MLDAEIGLSYFREQKLDMRLDRDELNEPPSAAQLLNWSSNKELLRLFKDVIHT